MSPSTLSRCRCFCRQHNIGLDLDASVNEPLLLGTRFYDFQTPTRPPCRTLLSPQTPDPQNFQISLPHVYSKHGWTSKKYDRLSQQQLGFFFLQFCKNSTSIYTMLWGNATILADYYALTTMSKLAIEHAVEVMTQSGWRFWLTDWLTDFIKHTCSWRAEYMNRTV